MTIATGLDWFRELLWTAVLVGGPAVLAGVAVGFLVAIVQAATQINDSAVSFAPKAIATVVALVVAAPWMLSQLAEFTSAAFAALGRIHP